MRCALSVAHSVSGAVAPLPSGRLEVELVVLVKIRAPRMIRITPKMTERRESYEATEKSLLGSGCRKLIVQYFGTKTNGYLGSISISL